MKPLKTTDLTRPSSTAPDNIELNCEGSGRPPRIADGKPHCRVCGQRFRWQEMEDRVRFVPGH